MHCQENYLLHITLNLTDSLFIWATIVVTYNMTLGILSHYKSIEEGSTEIQAIDKFARISSPLVANKLNVIKQIILVKQ